MADGILQELGVAIMSNIELILIVAVPLSALIGYIGKKINERILSVSDDTTENIDNFQKQIVKDIQDLKEKEEELKEEFKKLQEDMHKLEVHVRVAINSLEIRTENKRMGGGSRRE